MRNTFNASNVLYIKVAVKKNLDSKFLAVPADNFEAFAPKSALYYATLSVSSLYADLIKRPRRGGRSIVKKDRDL